MGLSPVYLLLLIAQQVLSLKDVLLTLMPRVVQRNQDVIMGCSYNLDGAKLYTIKFYCENAEFYKFTPGERNHTKIFPIDGIKVDLTASNSTQVKLLEIDFQLSRNFTCEVTTTEEPASTRTDTKSLLVVQLPDRPPEISADKRLHDGSKLRANCTAFPSKPQVRLKFVLNGLTVAYTEPWAVKKSFKPEWTDLFLELKLEKYHFDNGRLVLRCIAEISEIYKEEAVLEIGTVKEAVPQRVRAEENSKATRTGPLLLLISTIMILI